MAMTFGRKSNVITQTRQNVSSLFEAYENLVGLSASWNNGVKGSIVDASGDPKADGYAANDFAGHEGLTKADVNQALAAVMGALKTFMESPDGKKLEELRY